MLETQIDTEIRRARRGITRLRRLGRIYGPEALDSWDKARLDRRLDRARARNVECQLWG